jgi:hypothetical protein
VSWTAGGSLPLTRGTTATPPILGLAYFNGTFLYPLDAYSTWICYSSTGGASWVFDYLPVSYTAVAGSNMIVVEEIYSVEPGYCVSLNGRDFQTFKPYAVELTKCTPIVDTTKVKKGAFLHPNIVYAPQNTDMCYFTEDFGNIVPLRGLPLSATCLTVHYSNGVYSTNDGIYFTDIIDDIITVLE